MTELPALFHHILSPTDGSEPSLAAGQLAVHLAVFHQARLTFVYVIDPTVVADLARLSGRRTSQVQSDLEISGRRCLDHLFRVAAEANLASNQMTRYGMPYQEIANLAREQDADLIVMARVGRHGTRHILIGSVTERVMEHAPCSVLVVK
jgi:nucleotide-binding universal stress UspA family protein